MKNPFLLLVVFLPFIPVRAQDVMSPELLWQLGRVSILGISSDQSQIIYQVSTPSVNEDKSNIDYYAIPISGGNPVSINDPETRLTNRHRSPDGSYEVSVREVKIDKVFGQDFYPELEKSQVHIYNQLNYRHWDTWEDGAYQHLFVKNIRTGAETDIMGDQPYDCPQKPFGGEEDYRWSPDSKQLVYVTKRKTGTAYAVSTDTDVLAYDPVSGRTTNLSEGMPGYDVSPAYSPDGKLAWLSMKRDGYESDKNDIVIKTIDGTKNITASWDGTVSSFTWSNDGRLIYFTAPTDGTVQLFSVDPETSVVRQITSGDFDMVSLAGQTGHSMIVTRMDMNRASEIFSVDLTDGSMKQLTSVNDAIYQKIAPSKIERRYVTTTDKKRMLVWVIYPPGFNPSKKYPTLLYCQGGPQVPLTQFYSFRWNFQLMAAQGYIIVAPNRRGMPGHGVAWNEAISKDHGGQVMKDYLSAIDALSRESFVDKNRLGCVGASYGGYSVFFLAGIHGGRFKTFISHDGVFNLKSMYGTTEEMFFVNWDWGGPYWEQKNKAVRKTYRKFDPSNMVDRWDTPILIFQGGRDYRVPIGQGLEAFQAAQLRGIKSRLVYLPEENHWVLHPQNAIVWQQEFFRWLEETL
jgi:dipeptidyl aminopeptidase/acylaminoacyl peptidase